VIWERGSVIWERGAVVWERGAVIGGGLRGSTSCICNSVIRAVLHEAAFISFGRRHPLRLVWQYTR
jgi:hypothetical protein